MNSSSIWSRGRTVKERVQPPNRLQDTPTPFSPGAPGILFRGTVYPTPDDMPPELRRAYEQALKALREASPIGAPDAWEEGSPQD